jgi:sporulation-control protein
VVFKKMLGAFGIGGPSVDTVLSDPDTRPGAPLTGHVNLTGGSHDVDIEHITLSLVTRIEVEGGDGEHGAIGEFHRITVSGPMRLAEGQQASLPFQIIMPWEAPITDVYGQRLHGMTMGVRTEVSIARAVDKGDLDPVYVHPLPAQERILAAFAGLGFHFKGADLEYGQIHGVHQALPFYQEIEFFPAPQYAHGINEVELTFVTNPHAVEVILEFDKRGGMFTGGHDSFGRYSVAHTDADTVDWTQQVDAWVRQTVDGRQSAGSAYGQPAGYPGGHAAAHGGGHYDPHASHGHGGGHHDHHQRRGPGMGGVAAGVAGGLVAGYVAGEVIDEVFDDEGGDEGGDE